MEKDQTSEENPPKEETSEETAEEKETPKEETPKETNEPVVDYKAKFRDSQKEAIRLKNKVTDLETKVPKEEPKEDNDLETIVGKKVQEAVAPFTQKQEQEERNIVDKFIYDNPEAMDHLEEFENKLPQMRKVSKNLGEALENTFLLVRKDAAKQAGKKEMAFSLYQKEQAIASGGGASSSKTEESSELTGEERKVAQGLRIKEEAYAKRKR